MQKILIYIIIVIFSAGAIILGGVELLHRGEEEYIRHALEKANYCKVDGDCVIIEGVCPISCHSVVNLSEVDKMYKLLDEYRETCAYSCLLPKQVDCTSMQRCEIVY